MRTSTTTVGYQLMPARVSLTWNFYKLCWFAAGARARLFYLSLKYLSSSSRQSRIYFYGFISIIDDAATLHACHAYDRWRDQLIRGNRDLFRVPLFPKLIVQFKFKNDIYDTSSKNEILIRWKYIEDINDRYLRF